MNTPFGSQPQGPTPFGTAAAGEPDEHAARRPSAVADSPATRDPFSASDKQMIRSALASATWASRAASHVWRRYSEDRARPIRPAPHRPNPKAWPDRGLYAAWIGHSTVLLKVDGVTILTDPVFSPRVGIGIRAGHAGHQAAGGAGAAYRRTAANRPDPAFARAYGPFRPAESAAAREPRHDGRDRGEDERSAAGSALRTACTSWVGTRRRPWARCRSEPFP